MSVAMSEASFIARRRDGVRPTTTPTNPHTQLTQNAPPALQERVFEFARALGEVVVGRSAVSVPGAGVSFSDTAASGPGVIVIL